MKYPSKKQVRNVGRKIYKATGFKNPFKKGKLSSTRLIKDVQMLKSMINAEKKQITLSNVSDSVGQVNVNGYGNILRDITPVISQGVTGTTRNGISVKIHSMVLKGQLIQQANAMQAQKIKIEFFLNKGTYLSPSGLTGQILDTNGLNGLYDINSPRALDTFKNWSRVCSRTFTIGQDSQSGVTGFKDVIIPLKFKNWHIKYDQDNSTSITNGQMIMIVTADSGNFGSTNSTTNYIPVTGALTGSSLNYFIQFWFYDN